MNAIYEDNAALAENIIETKPQTKRKLIKKIAGINQDSLRYARMLQNDMLPNMADIRQIFPESALIYKPKEIVSGDFYWFSIKEGKALFALADCTGHGVPGAMISMIGTTMLNYVVKHDGMDNPSVILQHMNQSLQETFPSFKSDSLIRDGMDIGFWSLNLFTKKIEYCGAKRPLIIVKKDELLVIKGNSSTLGNDVAYDESYDMNQISLEKNDIVYLFSDGITDQFGGHSNKKYTLRSFKNLLWRIRKNPMEEQEKLIENEISNWIGDGDQIDDITIFGIKI